MSTWRPHATPKHENKDLTALEQPAETARPTRAAKSMRSVGSAGSQRTPTDDGDFVDHQIARGIGDQARSATDLLEQTLTPMRSANEEGASSLRKLVSNDIEITQKERQAAVGAPGRKRVEFKPEVKRPRPESLQKALQ